MFEYKLLALRELDSTTKGLAERFPENKLWEGFPRFIVAEGTFAEMKKLFTDLELAIQVCEIYHIPTNTVSFRFDRAIDGYLEDLKNGKGNQDATSGA